jgi:hypothetical protein
MHLSASKTVTYHACLEKNKKSFITTGSVGVSSRESRRVIPLKLGDERNYKL